MIKIFFTLFFIFLLESPAYAEIDILARRLIRSNNTGIEKEFLEDVISISDSLSVLYEPDPQSYFYRSIAYYLYNTKFPPYERRETYMKDWILKLYIDIEKAISLNNKFAEAYWLRGELYYYLDFNEAITLGIINENLDKMNFEKWKEKKQFEDYFIAKEIDNNFMEVYISLFDFFKYKDHKKAFACIDHAIDNSSADAIYKKSYFHFKNGKYEESIDEMSKAIIIDPDNRYFNAFMAQLYSYSKDYDSCINYMLKSSHMVNSSNIRFSHDELVFILKQFLKKYKLYKPISSIDIVSQTKVKIYSGKLHHASTHWFTLEKNNHIWDITSTRIFLH